MSGHDPIAMAELAISKMRSEGHESEYNIARTVIAALEGARVIPKWQPIETAPDSTDVLVLCDGDVCIARYNGSYKEPFWSYDVHELAVWVCEINPTHWMPLPSAPALTEKRQ